MINWKGWNVIARFAANLGYLHAIVAPEKFTLVRGLYSVQITGNVLSIYTFNTGVAKHTFCRICGIHRFYRPRSHPEAIDVNFRCLDGDILSQFEIKFFDGANWKKNINQIRD